MKTYHELFVNPDGTWKARVYRDNQVVANLHGIGGKKEAIKAVMDFKGERKPWWRVW